MSFRTFSTKLSGRDLILETGKMSQLSNGSVLVKYGETVILVNATASKEPKDGISFFPLSIDYEEKMYAVGKIPGSFYKKEGRPSENAILTSRVIDRPLRPLFPNDFRNDVCVSIMILSVDQDNEPSVAAMIGAAASLAISDIPFNGPVVSMNVGYVEGKVIVNPNAEERKKSLLNLTVAATKDKITMLEAGASEVSEEIMIEAIEKGHNEARKICEFIEVMAKEIGKKKFEYQSFAINEDVFNYVEKNAKEDVYNALIAGDKETRNKNLEEVKELLFEKYIKEYSEEKLKEDKEEIKGALEKLEKKSVRKMILEEGKRPDGRKLDEMRELTAEVALIPRVHGSGMFSRGQTQVLSIVTLGMASEEQRLDGLDEEESKRYMHHYNFPAYSVGEARASRGPGRREIGHGALAEKALAPVIPSKEEFPYAIRVVSEVLESNGSTSQASVCGSTLALMDAGVPLKRPVAGISAGLVTDENSDKFTMITDIQDIEDFYGDMDFKVAGTTEGITAIQVDIKIDGLTMEIVKGALERTRVARLDILENVMLKAIEKPREDVSKYAPKIITLKIKTDKIRDVIGQGGKVINKIIEETGVKIDIDETGEVFIYSVDSESGNKAFEIISEIVREIEVGEKYLGTVVRLMNFGAFLNIGGDKEGLLHISKISKERVNKIEDVLKEGDKVLVKVIEIDDQKRINLIKNDFAEELEKEKAEAKKKKAEDTTSAE